MIQDGSIGRGANLMAASSLVSIKARDIKLPQNELEIFYKSKG
jgi:hypothetical protein